MASQTCGAGHGTNLQEANSPCPAGLALCCRKGGTTQKEQTEEEASSTGKPSALATAHPLLCRGSAECKNRDPGGKTAQTLWVYQMSPHCNIPGSDGDSQFQFYVFFSAMAEAKETKGNSEGSRDFLWVSGPWQAVAEGSPAAGSTRWRGHPGLSDQDPHPTASPEEQPQAIPHGAGAALSHPASPPPFSNQATPGWGTTGVLGAPTEKSSLSLTPQPRQSCASCACSSPAALPSCASTRGAAAAPPGVEHGGVPQTGLFCYHSSWAVG